MAVQKYFYTGIPPPEDTVCKPDTSPFSQAEEPTVLADNQANGPLIKVAIDMAISRLIGKR
jgi:hypothetical protein